MDETIILLGFNFLTSGIYCRFIAALVHFLWPFKLEKRSYFSVFQKKYNCVFFFNFVIFCAKIQSFCHILHTENTVFHQSPMTKMKVSGIKTLFFSIYILIMFNIFGKIEKKIIRSLVQNHMLSLYSLSYNIACGAELFFLTSNNVQIRQHIKIARNDKITLMHARQQHQFDMLYLSKY